MANCWNCSTEIPDGTRYCPNCGKDQTFNPPAPGQNRRMNRGPFSSRTGQRHEGQFMPQMSKIERKINTTYTLVVAVLVLQILFIALLFLG